MRRIVPITKGGQISLPAEVRHRWAAQKVLLVDEGEQLLVKPVPVDPIKALIGKFPLRSGLTVDQITEQWRREEQEAEERKWREYKRGNLPRATE
jgi:hypothetical protein